MSNLRIGGLSSGIDVDMMVSDLMRVERMRVDAVKQKKQQVEWQREDFRILNSSLMALRTAAFNMKLQGTFLAKSTVSSNEDALTATAGVAAAQGSYTVTVTNLAAGVNKGSQSRLAEEKNADGTTKTLQEQFGDLADTITFTLEGKLGADGITRNSQAFTIDTATATVNTLVAEINLYSNTLGISASYDADNNRFFLTTTGTGADYGLRVTSDSDDLLSDATGAGSGKLQLLLQTGTLYQGQNARFDFGDVTGIESATNTATVNGLTLNLKQGGGATGTVTVTGNVDAVYNSIKAFVDQYNTTLELVNSKLTEQRYQDYLPLTDAQREVLSESRETAWEAKARSGMLKNDSYLTGAVSKIRSAASAIVSGIGPVMVNGQSITYHSLAAVGIVTGGYQEAGKLHLINDGAALKEAIQNDPEGVMKLFTQNTGAAGAEGIAQRLYAEVDYVIKGIMDKAGTSASLTDQSFLGKAMSRMDKQIRDMEDRLVKTEDRYWKQFTAMEKALNQLNAQSAWLVQQFSFGK